MTLHLLIILWQVPVILVVSGAPARVLWSPCPDVFEYEKIIFHGQQDKTYLFENPVWRGAVRVTPLLPIFLKIKFSVPAALPTKYVGRVELARNKNEIVRKFESGYLDKIKYYVYFPNKIPIPELILIEVNSRIICSHLPAPHRLKTILTLEHSLITVAANTSTGVGSGGAKTFTKPTARTDIKDKIVGNVADCGRGIFKSSFDSETPVVSMGDWPWMVPLFKKTSLGLQFFCSATLISYSFVVTAAHCVSLKNVGAVEGETIIAYVGRFDITNWTEENSQPREISGVFVHPDFDSEAMHSDLAILKFSKPVEQSVNAAPACLWRGDNLLSEVVGKKGVVFGWGTDGLGNRVTPTPRLAVMPVVSQEECLRSRMEFLYLTTNRTFCAGFRNGTGPCSGDSGGGFLIPKRDENGNVIWFLRGVVSLSLVQDGQVMCNVHEYTIFTDVAKYRSWINELLEIQ